MRKAFTAVLLSCLLGTLALGAAASAMTSEQSIVQVASANKSFTTLVSLLKSAGLVGALEGKGPFTVFAPTNSAFAKLPAATVKALEHNKPELKKVLLYHVVAGRYTAAEVVKHKTLKTLEGGSLTVTTKGAKVYVGGAQVITPNVAASNGIIHVIGSVLKPAS